MCLEVVRMERWDRHSGATWEGYKRGDVRDAVADLELHHIYQLPPPPHHDIPQVPCHICHFPLHHHLLLVRLLQHIPAETKVINIRKGEKIYTITTLKLNGECAKCDRHTICVYKIKWKNFPNTSVYLL